MNPSCQVQYASQVQTQSGSSSDGKLPNSVVNHTAGDGIILDIACTEACLKIREFWMIRLIFELPQIYQ